MNQNIILIGTILAIAAISAPMVINYTSDKTPQELPTELRECLEPIYNEDNQIIGCTNYASYDFPYGETGPQFNEEFCNMIKSEPPNLNDDVEDKLLYEEYMNICKIRGLIDSPPPLKQLKVGVPIQDIQCNEGKVLIFKQTTLSPACVSSDTWEKIMMPNYGWAKLRIGNPGEPKTQDNMCTWYPDMPLVQRNCVNDFSIDTTFSSVYPVNGTVDSIFYNESSNVIFDIPYTIQGGTIDAMAHDINANSLLVRIDSISDGFLTVEIPYQLLTYEEQIACDIFTLVNQEEVEHKISDNRNGNRIVTINFTDNYPLVEFIGITMPC